MSHKYFINAQAAIAALLMLTLFSFNMISCSDQTEEIGFSKSKESPDQRFSANATYFRNYKNETEYTARYEFEIIDLRSGLMIASQHDLPDDNRPHVIFRGGVGDIFWADDSKQVSFGTEDHTLWTWRAEKKQQSEQVAAPDR